MFNPFQYQAPEKPGDSLGRDAFTAELMQRVKTQGCALVISEMRCGKSTALRQLQSALQTQGGTTSLLEALRMGALKPEPFWESVFAPLRGPQASDAFVARYRAARQGRFEGRSLWALADQVVDDQLDLTVLIDDFDALLRHRHLDVAFFTDLERMVTGRRVFNLAATSNQTLEQLRGRVRAVPGQTAFPYFEQVLLGPLPSGAVHQLLRRQGDNRVGLSAPNQGFVARVAGGHPYLLQLTAAALWEASQMGARLPSAQRRQAAGRALSEIERSLGPAWRYRDTDERWAILRIMLAQIDLELPLLNQQARQRLGASGGNGAALLQLLGRLSEEELLLLIEQLSGSPAPLDVTGPAVLKTALQQIQANRAAPQVLAMVASWRPDLQAQIDRAAKALKLSSPLSVDLDNLQRRGVLMRDAVSNRLKLQSELMVWWLLDQMNFLARKFI
ncbi:MAG: hypothetical protein AAFV53_40195 [Myxococcota bacterium]